MNYWNIWLNLDIIASLTFHTYALYFHWNDTSCNIVFVPLIVKTWLQALSKFNNFGPRTCSTNTSSSFTFQIQQYSTTQMCLVKIVLKFLATEELQSLIELSQKIRVSQNPMPLKLGAQIPLGKVVWSRFPASYDIWGFEPWDSFPVQGCTKRLFPGCVNMKIAIPCLQQVNKTQIIQQISHNLGRAF